MAESMVGKRVKVNLGNGHKATGVIVRVFKNGRLGIRESNGKYYIRYAQDVTILR